MNLEHLSRAELLRIAPAAAELHRRQARSKQERRGGLIEFIRYFWHILEPRTDFVDGWALRAICDHLEAVTFGEIARGLFNVPPGFMKSLATNVFWPAWEWGAMDRPHERYVSFSYSAGLTERDNGRLRDLILSQEYQNLYGKRFHLTNFGVTKLMTNKTGWKLATSVGGVGTGERGTRILLDDPHNVKESESEKVRNETVRWFRESMSNRLNDLQKDAIVIIMQRVHDEDVSGSILSDGLDYCHLRIPMEFEPDFNGPDYEGNSIGWLDPRSRLGDLAWPERFPAYTMEEFKKRRFMWAGQYQQDPVPRGGGIVKRDQWQLWPAADYPLVEYVLASLDTAYTQKQENDPSALTIWGLFRDKGGNPRVILLGAWEGRLEFHRLLKVVGTMCSTSDVPKDDLMRILGWANEGSITYKEMPRFPVDKLIIEAKANGLSVAQEFARIYAGTGEFGIEPIDPAKLGGDKVARMHAVLPMFEDEMVFAPDTNFAEMTINNVSAFPKGSHDDLSDTVAAGLRYMRLTGLLLRKDEYQRNVTDEATFKGRQKALYPA